MHSTSRLVLTAGAAWLLLATAASACGSFRFDPVEEMSAIEAAHVKLAATLPAEKKTKLDELMHRIRVAVPSLGLRGAELHEGLRGEVMEILGIPRIPRWPSEKEEALSTSKDAAVATAAIHKAKAEWKAKHYDAANAALDDAVRRLGVSVVFARC